jgi:hypothetical protein
MELHNEEINSLYSSLNIVRVIKSRRLKQKRGLLGDLGIDGRTILERILKK